MPKYQDIADFFEKVNLAQKIAFEKKEMELYAGSDVEIARILGLLTALEKEGFVEEGEFKLIKTILQEQNKATFASSEKTDIYTKLGLMKPQKEASINLEEGSD